MARPKTFTADDIKMGVIRLNLNAGTLSLFQGYKFIDAAGDEIVQLPGRSIQENTSFIDLPENIKQALIDINAFMYQKALTREGMED